MKINPIALSPKPLSPDYIEGQREQNIRNNGGSSAQHGGEASSITVDPLLGDSEGARRLTTLDAQTKALSAAANGRQGGGKKKKHKKRKSKRKKSHKHRHTRKRTMKRRRRHNKSRRKTQRRRYRR